VVEAWLADDDGGASTDGMGVKTNELGVTLAVGAAVARTSAMPDSSVRDGSPLVSECIRKRTPEPITPMPSNDASNTLVDMAPSGAATRASPGLEAQFGAGSRSAYVE
jgi:hypothetical protein